ncbi:MAG: helix-turn-helix transcriptional regulator [Planctomycetaceae bacterium]|nr:helix-turn-helix transcriptional regulator [Planctomycetaceae bacterium]
MEPAATNNDALRDRLNAVLKDVSQAEIARRTGTSRANVNRYLRDRKIPAEFSAAVVAGFDVNPVWLLTGKGSPRSTETGAGTDELASRILDMVGAMEATFKMRLSAISSQSNARVFRDLHDAVDQYTRTLSRTSEHFKPLFKKLLEQFHQAILRKDYGQAQSLRPVVTFVSRLCDDPRLVFDLYAVEEMLDFLTGEPVKAIASGRRTFLAKLASGEQHYDDLIVAAVNYGFLLMQLRRIREAEGLLRVGCTLASSRAIDARYWNLYFVSRTMQAELGRLDRALPRLIRAFRLMSAENRELAHGIFNSYLFMGGVHSFDDWTGAFLASDKFGVYHRALEAGRIVSTACCLEDAKLIKQARKAGDGVLGKGRRDDELFFDLWSKSLLAAMSAKAGLETVEQFETSEVFKTAQGSQIPTMQLTASAALCQLLRLSGDKERATKQFDATKQLIEAADPGITFPVMQFALHHRNALGLFEASSKATKQARRFFARVKSNGYLIFGDNP